MRFSFYILSGLIVSTSLLFSGCGAVVQNIQDSVGNQITAVDDFNEGAAEEEEGSKKEKKTLETPKPYHTAEKIVRDEGEGKYASHLYDQKQVEQALDQMPKGMAEDQIFAYLLGLVGENYLNEKTMLDTINLKDSQKQFSRLVSEVQKKKKPAQKANIVVLLDTSNSMSDEMNGRKKLDWARESILQFARSLPPNTSLTVRTFGAQKKGKTDSCQKSELVFAGQAYTAKTQEAALSKKMNKLKAQGWSPLETAIKATKQDFVKGKGNQAQTENMLFIITDNGETCKGDPITAGRVLHQAKEKIRINVIGLQTSGNAEKDLQQLASEVNGHFEVVDQVLELQQVMQMNIQDIVRINDPWPLQLLDYVTRNFRSDQQRLNRHYYQMRQKLEREYQRLTHANDYINKKKKISGRDWVRLEALIQERYDQMDNYTDHRWNKINQQLILDFTKQSNKIKQVWVKSGQNPAILEQRKNQRVQKQNQNNR
jgi:Mg-chelatase subunit ChlD